MRLYLVQHGKALSEDVDPERSLSEEGRDDVRRLAALLKGRVRAGRVLHSGKTRARQTAELLAAALAPDRPIETIAGINPMDPVQPMTQQAQEWNDDTVLVGHLPYMGKLAARLVCGNEENAVVSFKPGALVCLEREGSGRWSVAWMLRPELTNHYVRRQK